MKIKATKCKGLELKPGDLFSTVGPEYWDHFTERDSIGERVYIRTNTPASNANDCNTDVYLIEVVKTNDPSATVERCSDCGKEFESDNDEAYCLACKPKHPMIFCNACSVVGGELRPIYHEAPACND